MTGLLFENGLNIDSKNNWHVKPAIGCQHLIREKMFYVISSSVSDGYFYWKANHNRDLEDVRHFNNNIVEDNVTHIIEAGLEQLSMIEEIRDSLTRAHINCHACRKLAKEMVPVGTTSPSSSKTLPVPLGGLSNQSVSSVSIHPHSLQTESTHSEQPNQDLATTDFRKMIRRRRNISAPTIDMSIVQQRILVHDPDFDDYNTGPTIQENLGVPLYIKSFPTFMRTQLDSLSTWSLWKDYGYQIDTSFAQTFMSTSPQLPAEHYLPVADEPGSEFLEKSLQQWDITCQEISREAVADICWMGMEELLSEAGGARTKQSFNAFIQGHRYK